MTVDELRKFIVDLPPELRVVVCTPLALEGGEPTLGVVGAFVNGTTEAVLVARVLGDWHENESGDPN